MVAVLNKGNYVIESILSENDETVIYTARNRERKRFIINEIKNVAVIDRFLPQMSALAKMGRLICLTENSHLYVITHYSDGENAAIYFRAEHTPVVRRLEMLKTAAFRMIDYSAYPEIVGRGMLQPESLCVCRGELCMNFFFAPYEQRDVFSLFCTEMEKMFTKEEIQKYTYIGIVLQKLKNGIYTDFTQVYLDMEQLIANCAKSGAIISGIKTFYEKIKAPLKIVFTAASLILAAVVLYNLVVSGSRKSAEGVYNPIDHIGTVSVDNSDEEFREFWVSGSKSY